MSHNAAEIEAIVRKVLNALLDGNVVRDPQPATEPDRRETGLLAIQENVISLGVVHGKLDGIRQVLIAKGSVVTPAARDYFRERKIQVIREGAAPIATMHSKPASTAMNTATGSEAASSSGRPQRLIVASAHRTIDAIRKQLCPKQAAVPSKAIDDTAALHAIANGLRNGHQAGVILANAPHAVCWQAARDDKLRPVVVTQWNDLGNALREVPLNVLIVPAQTWSVPAVCNAARTLFEHLRRT